MVDGFSPSREITDLTIDPMHGGCDHPNWPTPCRSLGTIGSALVRHSSGSTQDSDICTRSARIRPAKHHAGRAWNRPMHSKRRPAKTIPTLKPDQPRPDGALGRPLLRLPAAVHGVDGQIRDLSAKREHRFAVSVTASAGDAEDCRKAEACSGLALRKPPRCVPPPGNPLIMTWPDSVSRCSAAAPAPEPRYGARGHRQRRPRRRRRASLLRRQKTRLHLKSLLQS